MSTQKTFGKQIICILFSVLLLCGCFLSASIVGNAEDSKSGTIKIACVGDSLTEGYTSSGGLKGSTAYPAVLQNLLGDGYEVGNFGKTSYTLQKETVQSYWKSTEYTNSMAYDADVVIIMLGTNDSKAKYWNEAQFKQDAVALVESYEALESEPQIIFATSPHCYQISGTDITRDTVDMLYEVQKELIEEQGWDTLDMYALTADREDLYHTDKLHFTDEGYSYVAECVYEKIKGERPAVSGSVKIPHTKTTGTDNYFTFAENKWEAGNNLHTWSKVVDSADPRNTWYEVKFTGNKIDVYSGKNWMMGYVEYFVDGVSYGTFDLYNVENINSTLIKTISGLQEGEHTFRAEATGGRNASGRGNIAIDAAEVVVYSNNISAEPILGTNIFRMFDNTTDPGNNSWVFTGGEAVQGTFEQLGGARNYIGHFEEYARSQKSAGDDPTRQRYVINTAKEGQQLSDVIRVWDEKVTKFDPRAVTYMVGVEDYIQGYGHIEEYKESLRSFIDLALAEKANAGSFAVIQKPFAVLNDSENALIEAYCAAVDEVVAEYKTDAQKYANILVVDHYTQTKDNTDFQNSKLNADGSLNELGHLEIGKQFVAATMGMQDQYPCKQGVRMGQTAVEAPEQYVDILPAVSAGKDSLNVTILDAEEEAWKYFVEIDGVTISGNAAGERFQIAGLTEGKDYVLKIQSADGKKQLTTVKGVVKPGNKAVKDQQELNENQQKIRNLMETKDSLTWLFMGDSITHGLVYTYGYAGTPQMFEKFLKDDLGRTDDVVINTAVSGAYTTSTLNNIEQRLDKYVPDVVSIMLGTNDAWPDNDNIDPNLPMTCDQYEENLRTIIARIKEINPNAVIILRSPTPMTVDGDGRKAKALENIERMKKVAQEDPSLIYVDQYTEMNEALTTYSWLSEGNRVFLGNWLHPGLNGQIMMAKQFIEACGLWTEDSYITNLYYKESLTEEVSEVVPVLEKENGTIRMDLAKLASDSAMKLGAITLTADNGERQFSVSAKAGETFAALNHLPEGNYEVTVWAYLTDSAKRVTFAKQNLSVSEDKKTEESVVRLYGANRYETCYAIAEELKNILDIEMFDTVLVATGKKFADSLSGTYLASVKNAPILLTNSETENIAQLYAFIKANVKTDGTVYILGGEDAVSKKIDNICQGDYRVKRLEGDSRYVTNQKILEEAKITGSEIIVATGKDFADSLSASATGLPILLVKPDGTLTEVQKEVLKDISRIYIVGGTQAVSESYEKELEEFGTVERIGGKTRVETAVNIAEKFFVSADQVLLTHAKKFPDGLCGGPLAAALNIPLLLVTDSNTDIAGSYLEKNEIGSGYILGGEETLSDDVTAKVLKLQDINDVILKKWESDLQ